MDRDLPMLQEFDPGCSTKGEAGVVRAGRNVHRAERAGTFQSRIGGDIQSSAARVIEMLCPGLSLPVE